MPQLIVTQLQSCCGGALVPAAFFERGGEDRLLIFGDGETEIGAAARIVRSDRRDRRSGGGARRRDRLGLDLDLPSGSTLGTSQGDSNGSNWIVSTGRSGSSQR